MAKRESAQVKALKADVQAAEHAYEQAREQNVDLHRVLKDMEQEVQDWKRRFDMLLRKHCNNDASFSYSVSKG